MNICSFFFEETGTRMVRVLFYTKKKDCRSNPFYLMNVWIYTVKEFTLSLTSLTDVIMVCVIICTLSEAFATF